MHSCYVLQILPCPSPDCSKRRQRIIFQINCLTRISLATPLMKNASPCRFLGALFWAFSCFVSAASAANTLNYQGRVISGGTAFTGSGQFKFALVSADGSTVYWKNDGTTDAAAPTTSVPLTVTKGIFSVRLGDTSFSNMTAISSSVFSNTSMALRIWFNDGARGFQQLSPDQTVSESALTTAMNRIDYSSQTDQILQQQNLGGTSLAFHINDMSRAVNPAHASRDSTTLRFSSAFNSPRQFSESNWVYVNRGQNDSIGERYSFDVYAYISGIEGSFTLYTFYAWNQPGGFIELRFTYDNGEYSSIFTQGDTGGVKQFNNPNPLKFVKKVSIFGGTASSQSFGEVRNASSVRIFYPPSQDRYVEINLSDLNISSGRFRLLTDNASGTNYSIISNGSESTRYSCGDTVSLSENVSISKVRVYLNPQTSGQTTLESTLGAFSFRYW